VIVLLHCKYCEEIKGFGYSLPAKILSLFMIFSNIFSDEHWISRNGNMCNKSFRYGCYFSIMEMNVHFRLLFISKFELFKLYLKVYCIWRFVYSNKCLNSTKFVWTLLRSEWPHDFLTLLCVYNNGSELSVFTQWVVWFFITSSCYSYIKSPFNLDFWYNNNDVNRLKVLLFTDAC